MSVFEAVINSIGMQSAIKLMNDLGGLTFYIPKIAPKDYQIYLDIKRLESAHYSKSQILTTISTQYALDEKTVLKKLKYFKKLEKNITF